ncbi:hypothetical protein IMZ48_23565 [Candidatus Bathyarchaeota archaeon]|nr:hypothetical protein [Candidatus Bathyarchaeota archaeon]
MSIWKSIYHVWDTVCYEVGGIGYKPLPKKQRPDRHRDTPRSSSSIDSFQRDYNRHRHRR